MPPNGVVDALDFILTSVLGAGLMWGMLNVTHSVVVSVPSPGYASCLLLFALVFLVARLLLPIR